MTDEDLKIILVKDNDDDVYIAWIPAIPGLIIEVDNIEDVPKELATSLRVILEYMVENKNYEIMSI